MVSLLAVVTATTPIVSCIPVLQKYVTDLMTTAMARTIINADSASAETISVQGPRTNTVAPVTA